MYTSRTVASVHGLCRAQLALFRKEFVVLLPETGSETVVDVATRICEKSRELRIETGGGVQRLSVSIGAASFPGNGDSLEDPLRAADMALFAAKDAGRDQVRAVEQV
jgi:diguanylate cyclase (GGDEF)-like protein